ncbi:hypothetical protein [Paraburkholderia antibiotica]|uniref:Uncharacterized protein n=1 Tax=Paraburkholderia antibiotica TaxID=2728839 RepID=A0A7X9X4G4_9BURK|nr:hypothetical protein [Paraburkholderia antibiotica]NML31250.1 hypothetical protein [Paraburkholderia antibiotica]
MAMSMILDRTLSMRGPSVRQSSVIRRLVEIRVRIALLALPLLSPGQYRFSFRDRPLFIPDHGPTTQTPDWPNLENFIEMSEYPCTDINKAALKFPPQDRKISQIVSVKISVFFPTFMR